MKNRYFHEVSQWGAGKVKVTYTVMERFYHTILAVRSRIVESSEVNEESQSFLEELKKEMEQ